MSVHRVRASLTSRPVAAHVHALTLTLTQVWAAIFASLILHDSISSNEIAGGACIVMGCLALQLPEERLPRLPWLYDSDGIESPDPDAEISNLVGKL